MSPQMQAILFGLQTRLITAFVGIVVVALLLAAAVLVYVQRGEAEEQALAQAGAAGPAIVSRYLALQEQLADAAPPERASQSIEFIRAQSDAYGVRIFEVAADGKLLHDSAAGVAGSEVTEPAFTVTGSGVAAFKPGEVVSTAGGDLVVANVLDVPVNTPLHGSSVPDFEAGSAETVIGTPRAASQFLFAVPESTIASAWLGLLPELGVAATIVLPVAVLLAVLLARYITRPLHQLTLASQQIAVGQFDVEVPAHRRDEIGRLARSFVSMAQRVGATDTRMRALVADVSHDLRTPLTSILGFGKALRDGVTNAESSRRAGTVIYEEASRLDARLADLLYASQLESGQVLLHSAPVDLSALVRDTAERVEARAVERGLNVSVDVPEAVVRSVDAPRLERAIENLVTNAVKFARSGGAVRVALHEDPAGGIRIEVANTVAEGIDAGDLPRFFERFYRRDRVRGGGKEGGAGLGLPIARDIVELHGGTLTPALVNGDIVFTIALPEQGSVGARDGTETPS